jgi:hypothetical protein
VKPSKAHRLRLIKAAIVQHQEAMAAERREIVAIMSRIAAHRTRVRRLARLRDKLLRSAVDNAQST